MKLSNKVRLIFAGCLSVALFAAFLAIEREGAFIWFAVIVAPLMLLVPFVVTGGFVCPKCGGGIYTPPSGTNDVNPYYKVVLFGKCYHCGHSI